MKKIFKIKGMHCNSCANRIEDKLKDKVENISVNYSKEQAEIKFDENKISEKEIKENIKECGYEVAGDIVEEVIRKQENKKTSKIGWIVMGASVLILLFVIYWFFLRSLEIAIPEAGNNIGLFLLFLAGILTGFHCIAMCGGFVVSYTAKNALEGHKSFKQHLIYGGSKVISYTIIGGVFGLIGGIFAFSIGLRGWVAIFAGLFMIVYAFGMFGFKFFRKFQFNPKFLTRFAAKEGGKFQGAYSRPMMIGLLNGLFLACGPLQAMYLYAAGTGSFFNGATSLMAFGLGTLPIMLGFGSLATTISHKTTSKILKISAVIVLILGLIMLNRGLTLTGSSFSYDSIKAKFVGVSSSNSVISGNVQEINMNVDGSGYNPNSFVLKKGIPVKWNVNVKQLTGCNSELISNEYNINARLKTGINTFEFTPDKTGTFGFSCGMGMLRGSFIVTESGTASTEQISDSAQSGGSCGMGAGCGCMS